MELEDSSVLQWIADAIMWLVGVIVTVLISASAWLAKRRIEYVDGIDTRVSSIERNYLTREDFEHFAERVENMLAKVHDRVYELKVGHARVDDDS